MKKGYSFKHLLLVILACCIGFAAYSQQTNFNDSWGKAGFTLQQTDASHLKINYSIVEFTFSEQEIENEVLQNISLPGYFPHHGPLRGQTGPSKILDCLYYRR